MVKKLTTVVFISRAKDVHGDLYDYGKVEYEEMHKKITIVCEKHGRFLQTPNNHLRGNGCPECSGHQSVSKNRLEWFIGKAYKVHSDRYDYSKVLYTNARDKVSIICRQHGEFLQSPNKHLSGRGCPECARISRPRSKSKGVKRFVEDAQKVHGDTYDYSQSHYKGTNENIKIICKEHGAFLQTPHNHLVGKGCRDCALERNGWWASGFYGTLKQSSIYVLSINDSFIKVGLSTDVDRRMNIINKESGYSVEKIISVPGRAYCLWLLEQTILRHSGFKRHYPDASFGGQSECLELEELPKVLQIIEEWVDNQSEEAPL